MYIKMKTKAMYCAYKVEDWFKDLLDDETGSGELIATLVIVGVAVIIGFTFKDKILDLAQKLWDTLLVNKSSTVTIDTWNAQP